MKSRQRRVRAIELCLTPPQVVVVWLRNAPAGTLEEGARHSPPVSWCDREWGRKRLTLVTVTMSLRV
jgi:hypothetical protein